MSNQQTIVSRAVCTLLALAANVAIAQEPPKHSLVATAYCVDCHFKPAERLPDVFQLRGEFCRREQTQLWEHEDKHRRSFDLIATGEGLALTNRILGFPLGEVLDLGPFPQRADGLVPAAKLRPNLPADDPRVQTVQRCLACHAPIEEDPAGAGDPFIEYGVSCQACHGPGSGYEALHQRPEWRLVKADVKERTFGLRDLRHPRKKAELCASCHVGSFASDPMVQGSPPPRFVKHEWYAKGHPPLPGLELAAFAGQMPAHWQPLAGKLSAAEPIAFLTGEATEAQIDRFIAGVPRSIAIERDSFAPNYLAANAASFSADPARDLARAKESLVAAVAVLGSYAALVADAPQAEAMDFALFDCAACHHELRSASALKTRVRRGITPGRPPMPEWPRLLARMAAGNAEEFDRRLAELDQAYAARPFGVDAARRTAAGSLRELCTNLGNGLVQQPLDEAAGMRLMRLLTSEEPYAQRQELRDYATARQLAWATRGIALDLAGVPLRDEAPQPMPPGAVRFREIFASAIGHETPLNTPTARRQIEHLFAYGDASREWDGPLRLQLPSGQAVSIVENLPGWLEAISTYDDEAFNQRLRAIHAALR
jgi:hypothetical protein